jgi:hypothetical protein
MITQRSAAELAGLKALLAEMPDDPFAKPLLQSRVKELEAELKPITAHENIRNLFLALNALQAAVWSSEIKCSLADAQETLNALKASQKALDDHATWMLGDRT